MTAPAPNPVLDEEALALLRAATDEPSIATLPGGVIGDFWRRAAIKARELHGKEAPGPRFAVKTAPKQKQLGDFWIIHDTEEDRVYPFGLGEHSKRRAEQALPLIAKGKPTVYFAVPSILNSVYV